jgi:hypothetical protein
MWHDRQNNQPASLAHRAFGTSWYPHGAGADLAGLVGDSVMRLLLLVAGVPAGLDVALPGLAPAARGLTELLRRRSGDVGGGVRRLQGAVERRQHGREGLERLDLPAELVGVRGVQVDQGIPGLEVDLELRVGRCGHSRYSLCQVALGANS